MKAIGKEVKAMNDQNLKSFSERTPRERSELGRKGAEKANATKRARKTLREELLALLAKGDTQNRMSLAILEKAMNGDIRAFEVIRDSIGEKPKEQVETSGEQTINVKFNGDIKEWSK